MSSFTFRSFGLSVVISSALALTACGAGTPDARSPGSPKAPDAPVAPDAPTSPGGATTGEGGVSTTTDLGTAGAGTKLPSTETKPASGKTSEPGRGVDDIRVSVLAKRDEARACYDKALADHPGLEGDVVVKWTIDPKGAVVDALVDDMRSTIHEPAVGKCIVDVVKKIRFSASGKGLETRTSYPFNFNPKSSGKIAPSGSK